GPVGDGRQDPGPPRDRERHLHARRPRGESPPRGGRVLRPQRDDPERGDGARPAVGVRLRDAGVPRQGRRGRPDGPRGERPEEPRRGAEGVPRGDRGVRDRVEDADLGRHRHPGTVNTMIPIAFFFGGGRRTDQTAGRTEGLSGSLTVTWSEQLRRKYSMWK